jgi:hypothetical protein
MNAPTELKRAVRPMGLYYDMPFDDYHAVEAVSASGLRLFARSPWHYRNRVLVKPTRPMLRGSLVHCARLEPDAVGARYAVVPDDAPKRPTAAQWAAKNPNESSQAAMQWWREWEHTVGVREIITAPEFGLCQQQLKAITAVPEIAELFDGGHGEVSIFWIDPRTKLYCKARLDWMKVIEKRARVAELKSTRDESPGGFGRTSAQMKYDLQRAHYVEAVKRGTKLEFEDFTFVAVTSAAPVLAVPYDLTDELIAQSNDEREEHLERLAWCLKEDQWPAYGQGKQLLDFPAYAKRSGEIEFHDAEGITA